MKAAGLGENYARQCRREPDAAARDARTVEKRAERRASRQRPEERARAGPSAAAHSASKAALTQLARVAALEWGGDKIRVNIMHSDAVFDTGLWAGGVLEARSESYGLSLEQYKTKNVLRTEVSSCNVAALAVALCGRLSSESSSRRVETDLETIVCGALMAWLDSRP